MNFLLGGVSGCFATCCIQPIDFVKVQIQIRSEAGQKGLSPYTVFKDTLATHGMKKFYAGLDSALLRQVLYTSTRLGIFYQLTDQYTKSHGGSKPPVSLNALYSLVCGAVGSFVANPADLILIRMQADAHLPAEERRNYKNVADAIVRTIREEGFFSLWRGCSPTVVRAMSLNLALLVPFEETKKFLTPYVKNPKLRSIYGSLVAGVLASIAALPFDNIKTKLQKMKKGPDGQFPYNGLFDAIRKTIAKEGINRLWVGLGTFYTRIAPHVIITFVTNDFLRSLIGQH